MPLKPLYQPKPKRLPRRNAVTVCIGAIAERNILIGISDRMLTASGGEIEFEPDQVKAWSFSNSILALVAGDVSIQTMVMSELDIEVKDRIRQNPKEWVSVREVTNLYCEKLRALRRKHAEEQILHPLGLDLIGFLGNQMGMQPEFVADIKNRLLEWEFPSLLETIFMGIDTDVAFNSTGGRQMAPQLYVTQYDRLTCLNNIGFAAIGIGKNHAESQFMFSGHWPQKAFDETLLLAYAAKKRAQAAPGVGKKTDILIIGPGLGVSMQVEQKHIDELDSIYLKSRKATEKATQKAQKETSEFVVKARQYYTEKQEKDKLGAEKLTPKALTEPSLHSIDLNGNENKKGKNRKVVKT
jgi:hypothetical protein